MPAGRRGARVAIVKPDFRVAGGFERVVDHVEALLVAQGHELTRLTVDMIGLPRSVRGLDVPDDVYEAMPEYFRYVAGVEAFDALDTRRYDLVLSTQPPSVAHRHPRHLSLLYHHARVFYDLEEVYLRAGFSPDPALHAEAARLVRELDQPRYHAVSWFLAGSEVVKERLHRFNGLTNASVLRAGMAVGSEADAAEATPPGTGAVLSIGRHEFTKRTELVVAAGHRLGGHPVAVVGTGGRTAWARSIDGRLATGAVAVHELTAEDLWCNTGLGPPAVGVDTWSSPVSFLTRVDDDTLTRLYREAPCVVAPAFNEDYGLTAVEAMAHGRPVVVCADGGGLAELVEHEVTGLVVDPTPEAIADAVQRLLDDPDLAARLGARGRERAAEITWAAADEVVLDGFQRVLDEPRRQVVA